MINYGLPMMGSKNQIAKSIICLLPKADYFVDLFCGGCAVTDAAIRYNRYKHYIINDTRSWLPKTYINALNGAYKDERRWISRDDFNKLKYTDGIVAICWSFNNNCKDYLYPPKTEAIQKAWWYSHFYKDDSLINQIDPSEYKDIRKELRSAESLNRIQSLERIKRIQNLEWIFKTDIKEYSLDYSDVPLPENKSNTIIYCDPPYYGTDAPYVKSFDFERFYKWCETTSKKGYYLYISEYYMPLDRFKIIWRQPKAVCTSGARTHNNERTEFIFTPINQPYHHENISLQMNLFDL